MSITAKQKRAAQRQERRRQAITNRRAFRRMTPDEKNAEYNSRRGNHDPAPHQYTADDRYEIWSNRRKWRKSMA